MPRRQQSPGQYGNAHVYDLSRTVKSDGKRHLLDKPELLTEEAVEALIARNIEVTVKTDVGAEVVLVPKYTEQERCELSYRDARTLVMVLQVFPSATLEQITKPTEEAS
jgi:hypothetical protein